MLKFESISETESKGKGWEWKKMTEQLRKVLESREQNGSLNEIPGF